MGTRVLKAHTDAVMNSLDEGIAVLNVGGREAFAAFVATKVLTAEDHSKTRYAVICREETTNAVTVYGPYATVAAANKAILSGNVGLGPGARAGIWPLIPSPKIQKRSSK